MFATRLHISSIQVASLAHSAMHIPGSSLPSVTSQSAPGARQGGQLCPQIGNSAVCHSCFLSDRLDVPLGTACALIGLPAESSARCLVYLSVANHLATDIAQVAPPSQPIPSMALVRVACLEAIGAMSSGLSIVRARTVSLDCGHSCLPPPVPSVSMFVLGFN